MTVRTLFLLVAIQSFASLAAAAPSVAKTRDHIVAKLPSAEATMVCGAINEPPTAALWDDADREPRKCPAAQRRKYSPKYQGLAYQILDFESEACFVPDESYRILDDIVDKVIKRVKAEGPLSAEQKILLISSTTSSVLTDMGFALWIPTATLSDAMIQRRSEKERFRHLFDCDTGSMILLTIAEILKIPASLVESTIPSNSDPKKIVQHNFVRWPIDPERSINWDMNAKQVCSTPMANQLPYQGKNLTISQVWAYERSLRGSLWERQSNYEKALLDYKQAIADFPERPGNQNNFAWLVATKNLSQRRELLPSALAAAVKASEARVDANVLDTLACIYALAGNFDKAIETEMHAVDAATEEDKTAFERRLNKFRAEPRSDCTGEL
jgi:hypothetical protein